MKRAEFLIKELRDRTIQKTANAVSDELILGLLSDTCTVIQGILMSVQDRPNIFLAVEYIDALRGQEFYPLPPFMWAENGLYCVFSKLEGSDRYRPLRPVDPTDAYANRGYYVLNKEISFSPSPNLNQDEGYCLRFYRQIEAVDKRRGTISARTTGSITLTGGSDPTQLADYVCVVDKDGVVLQRAIPITAYNSGTGVLTCEADSVDLAKVPVGAYIVAGENASSHPQLPDACLPFLLDNTEKRILARQSSPRIPVATTFTEQQRSDMIAIFADKSKDVDYPPLTDTSWGF